MLAEVMRHVLYRRRVNAAQAWRDAQRAEYETAVRRIVEQGAEVPDPVRRPR
jgi:hypothetical protein